VFYLLASPVRLSFPAGGAAERQWHAPPDPQAPLDLSSPPAGPDNRTIPEPSPCRVARARSRQLADRTSRLDPPQPFPCMVAGLSPRPDALLTYKQVAPSPPAGLSQASQLPAYLVRWSFSSLLILHTYRTGLQE